MKQILAIIVTIAPLLYSGYLLIRVHNIKKNSDEDELEKQKVNIQRLKKSSSIFLFVAVFMGYQYYKLFLA